ncbi:MAG: hypothetical protein M3Z04_00510 [Chloroflexota bacterium]|nr:hypothetical protein [Chloroflexota bacterium]
MAHATLDTLELYDLVSAGGETVAANSQATMQEISYRIEGGIRAAGGRGVFYASFQQLSRFADQIHRYRELTAYCERIYVFGIADWTPPPIENVVYVPLAPGSGLAKEWFLVYDTPGYFTGLIAHDTSGLSVPGDQRVFKGAWTFQAPIIGSVRAALDGALERIHQPVLHRDYEQQQRLTAGMINEVVGSLERGNREIRWMYDQVQATNGENTRLQAIVRRYVAGSTWEEAERSSRDGVETPSQLRRVTVMFTDIVEFTRFSEDHRPQEVVLALNGYFWWISRIVAQHGGEINKYTGDGVLAVFPDARRALAAASEILTRLAEWNAQRLVVGQVALQTRIGINTGQAVMGTVGGPDRQDRTVLGDTVNTAARLQSAAMPDTMLISAATFEAAAGPSGYQSRRLLQVKGKVEPLTVYEYAQGTSIAAVSSALDDPPVG